MWRYQQAQTGPTLGGYCAGGQMKLDLGLLAHHLQTGTHFSGTVDSSFEHGYYLTLELPNGQRIRAPMYQGPKSHGGNQHHADSAMAPGSKHVHMDHHTMYRGGQEHGQGGVQERTYMDHHAMYRGGQEHGQGGVHEHTYMDPHALPVDCNNPKMQHKRVRAAFSDVEDMAQAMVKLATEHWET
eukprot:gene18950-25520_t